MKRKIVTTVCFFIFSSVIFYGVPFGNSVLAQTSENYIIAVKSNNAWILDKTSRKLMFIQYKEKDEVWKSEKVIVPSEFNLNHCLLEAVGNTGTYAFLCDQSSGLMTLYQIKKDHSLLKFMNVDLHTELK